MRGWWSVFCSVEGQPPGEPSCIQKRGHYWRWPLHALHHLLPVLMSSARASVTGTERLEQGQRGSYHHLEPHNSRLHQATDMEVMENQSMNIKYSWSIPLADSKLSLSSLQTQLLHLRNYCMLSFCPLPSHHILLLITLIAQIAKSSGKVKHVKIVELSLFCLILTTSLHNIKKTDFRSISLKHQKTNKWWAWSV